MVPYKQASWRVFSGLRRRIVADNEDLAQAVTCAWARRPSHVRPAFSRVRLDDKPAKIIKGPTAADSDQALDLLLR